MPPPQGFVKLNVDAAFQGPSQNGGLGFIVRAPDGHPPHAVSQNYVSPSILIGEALGIRNGLDAAIKSGYLHLIVEFDCQELINILMGITHMLMTFTCYLSFRIYIFLVDRLDQFVFNMFRERLMLWPTLLLRKGATSLGRVIWSTSIPWLAIFV
ncbi:hypothetical protein NE237_026995 [Protea cynaroides]|uniref:RNase H type-1 domain-containing protein n=1 Tax=Protea cynaroides TaxID=273540 RepID=A0A9Q0JU05_9MAGN|nr:hypothetical protein NE237_026995 [Protea cynaroides]